MLGHLQFKILRILFLKPWELKTFLFYTETEIFFRGVVQFTMRFQSYYTQFSQLIYTLILEIICYNLVFLWITFNISINYKFIIKYSQTIHRRLTNIALLITEMKRKLKRSRKRQITNWQRCFHNHSIEAGYM